ncbi:hypothetical protein L2E82_49029 [Cichorium intybus]|uniref:Uncharacterized protein n=1 Tax=Cichorium intybus TaxID=13427 RepID=A0ACB8Z3J2_CICIN|nr:hypothetical protein L2E82_49029 [Cichorium intybus]
MLYVMGDVVIVEEVMGVSEEVDIGGISEEEVCIVFEIDEEEVWFRFKIEEVEMEYFFMRRGLLGNLFVSSFEIVSSKSVGSSNTVVFFGVGLPRLGLVLFDGCSMAFLFSTSN